MSGTDCCELICYGGIEWRQKFYNMNFAKGIKNLGYLFTVVGLLILSIFIAGEGSDSEARV